jgi:hypothetical protein
MHNGDHVRVASTAPGSRHGAPRSSNENHYAVSTVNAFNNPMYAEGLQYGNATPSTSSDSPERVEMRHHNLPKEDLALQAGTRFSMSPILLGDDGIPTATYDQVYKTTGTFKE